MEALATVNVTGIPGGAPVDLILRGEFRHRDQALPNSTNSTAGTPRSEPPPQEEYGLFLTGSAQAHFRKQQVKVTVGVTKPLAAHGWPGLSKVAVVVKIPTGLNLLALSGMPGVQNLNSVPKLTESEISASNFKGMIRLPDAEGAMKEYYFDARTIQEMSLHSGCVVPVDGPLGRWAPAYFIQSGAKEQPCPAHRYHRSHTAVHSSSHRTLFYNTTPK